MSNETFVNRKINENVLNIIKKNIYIVAYILQMIFILIYTEPQLQPFVYVRF
jgi:hypothetical protein